MQIQEPKQGYKTIYFSTRWMKTEIPEEWEIVSFGDISERITYGFTNPMPDTDDGPWMITATNIKNGRIDYTTARQTDWKPYKELLSDKSRPKIGTVLITKDGTLGEVAIVDKENLCINQSVASLEPKKLKITSEFLSMTLQSPLTKKLIEVFSPATTIRHISITDLAEWKLGLPPTAEQQKITSILSSVDFIIQKIEKEIEQTQKLKKELMQKLLTKGIGHTEFRKIPFMTKFIDFSIPKSWDVKKLSEISIEIKDGPMGFNLHNYDYVEHGIPILRIQNLKDLTVTKNDLRFITKKKHEELEKSQVKPHDIIISKTGVLGMIGVVPMDYGPANLNQALARIQLKNKSIVDYVTMFLASKIPQQILSVMGSGRTVQAGLKMSDIKELVIPIPPKEEQDKITSIILSRILLIQKQQEYKSNLENLKKGLMQKLLTGQIRVKV